MSGMQWLLLILVVAAVSGAYLLLRREADGDPWQGMGESDDPPDFDDSESLGGDSYVVGVRTLDDSATPESAPAAGESAPPAGEKSDDSWDAFSPDQRAPGRPTATETPRAQTQSPPLQPAPSSEPQLFILHIARRDGGFFDGPDIHNALQENKLKFGINEIYHRITETNGVPESVFCVANMLKPGFLDPVEQDELRTPGLTVFLQLPGPLDGNQAARDMLETVSNVAERLGGQVLDEQRSLLKPQTAQYMLDQVAEMERKRRVAGKA